MPPPLFNRGRLDDYDEKLWCSVREGAVELPRCTAISPALRRVVKSGKGGREALSQLETQSPWMATAQAAGFTSRIFLLRAGPLRSGLSHLSDTTFRGSDVGYSP